MIARQLCDNAGFDATNILNKLRQKHAQDGGVWYGVDILNEDIADNFLACVWEPAIVKSNAIVAASEATCLLLRWSFYFESLATGSVSDPSTVTSHYMAIHVRYGTDWIR